MNILRRMSEMKDLAARLIAVRMGNLTPENMGVIHSIASLETRLRIWRDAGAKTFILTSELVEAFQYTDISLDVKSTDFHYPFTTFMIESYDRPLFSTGDRGRAVDIHAILYVSSRAVCDHGGVKFIEPDGKVRDRLDWSHSIYGLFVGADGFGLDGLLLNLDEESTIREIAGKRASVAMLPVDKADAQNLVNLFYNTVLYLSDPARPVTETESKGTRKHKTGNGKETVRSEYILLKPPRSYIPLRTESGDRTVMCRFVVRGHWRNQAFGEHHGQRRMTWIKPFWKGPEMSEIISKPYLVKG